MCLERLHSSWGDGQDGGVPGVFLLGLASEGEGPGEVIGPAGTQPVPQLASSIGIVLLTRSLCQDIG